MSHQPVHKCLVGPGLWLETVAPSLADHGVDKVHSHRFQTEAQVPDDRFERFVAEAKAKGDRGDITSAGVYRLAKRNEPKPEPVPPPEGQYSTVVMDPP